MLSAIVLIVYGVTSTTAFCPAFLTEDKTCSCFAFLDGAVIKCRGPKATTAVEKLKSMPIPPDIRELTLESANIVEVSETIVFIVDDCFRKFVNLVLSEKTNKIFSGLKNMTGNFCFLDSKISGSFFLEKLHIKRIQSH